MNRLILADNQAIFRAGAARVLALEDDIRIAAQCEDGERLNAALEGQRGVVILVSSSLRLNLKDLLARVRSAASRVILVAENGEQVDEDVSGLFDGVLSRNVSGQYAGRLCSPGGAGAAVCAACECHDDAGS